MTMQPKSHPPVMLTEVVLPGVVEPDGLIVQQRTIPVPGAGQALVQMLATGASFGEQGMRRGRYPGQPKFPFVLGYDLVGVVTAVGPGVDTTLVGQRVAAVVKTGGWTTHAVLDARILVPSRTPLTRPRPRPSCSTVTLRGRCCTARPRSGRVRRFSSTAPAVVSVTPWPSWPVRRASASSAPPRLASMTSFGGWASNRSTTTTRTWPTG